MTGHEIQRALQWLNDPATKTSHPHLEAYLTDALDRPALEVIIGKSLEKLAFFTKHPPRALEYPWVIDQVSKTDGLIIDIGAGLSPIPFLLADRGRQVLTIDYSDLVRDPANRQGWSEWGYLDYSLLDTRIRSMNIDFALAPIEIGSAGCIYSVSVIEHMPAETRRKVWQKVTQSLRPGGSLILTVDLKPVSHYLWNLDRGKQVESEEKHGTVGMLIDELGTANIGMDQMQIARGLSGSGTNILLIRARKLK